MDKEKKVTLFEAVRFYKEAECSNCPLMDLCDGNCADTILNSPEEASNVIIKWCNEHPAPTK